MRNFSALLAGLVFGIGLAVSGMLNPQKVIGFLDLFGNWDPSLAFVMGGALLVTIPGYRLVWSRPAPMFDTSFSRPTNTRIDTPLMLGALMFGAGWGLVGLCPGPAVAALSTGSVKIVVFVAAMAAGMAAYNWFGARPAKAQTT